jgi:hypothetical protein
MGSPVTCAPLWENQSFTKQRTILVAKPYSEENYYTLKAREAIMIQEAWKKYGNMSDRRIKLKVKAMFHKADVARSLREIAWSFGVESLCLNMTDGHPRKTNGGYHIYLAEKKRIDKAKSPKP